LIAVAAEGVPPYTARAMAPSTRPRRILLASACLVLLMYPVPGGWSEEGGDRGTVAAWERKLDPFLRPMALGTLTIQGRFTGRLPPGSLETARALPGFVQIDRSTAPVLHVKAGLRESAVETAHGRATFEEDLR